MKILTYFIKKYKNTSSLLRNFGFPVFIYTTCKYHPSCSDYALEAIPKYGLKRGIVKSAWRVLKCNPFSKGGVDIP